MTKNLITIIASGNEKLNIELDATGVWTLRKHSTPGWRRFCAFPNGHWSEINGLWGRELCLYDANRERCFSVLAWGSQSGKVQLVKNSTYGEWAFTSKPNSNTSFTIGLGFKAGGQLPFVPLGAVGCEQAFVLVYSPDEASIATPFSVSSLRLGAGKGGSTGAILAIIRGFNKTADLNGFVVGGVDYNLAMGPNIKGFLKGGILGKIVKNAQYLKTACGHLSRQQWETMATLVKDSAVASEFVADCDEPSVTIYDLPGIGGGYEISAFYSAGVMQRADMASFIKAMGTPK